MKLLVNTLAVLGSITLAFVIAGCMVFFEEKKARAKAHKEWFDRRLDRLEYKIATLLGNTQDKIGNEGDDT